MTFFGLISYAVYMTHLYVLWGYDHFLPLTPGDGQAYAVCLAAVVATSIPVSLLSRYLIELPAVSLRKRVLKQPPKVRNGNPAFPP